MTERFPLRTHADFFHTMQRISGRRFTMYVEDGQTHAFAVVVPQGVAPLATRRNQIKRRAKAVFDRCTQYLHPLSCVLVWKRGGKQEETSGEIYEDLIQTLSRTRYWNGSTLPMESSDSTDHDSERIRRGE